MRITALRLASFAILLGSCKSAARPGPAAPAAFTEHAEVIAAIESNRLDDAATALKKAPDTSDVHFLRARLAEARIDSDTAYREIKLATAAEPGSAEYQYEFGVIAGMPGGPGQSIAAQAGRFAEAGPEAAAFVNGIISAAARTRGKGR